MTLRHMIIFRTVCESECNSTKAANALNMTQPAVSLAIKELDCALIESPPSVYRLKEGFSHQNI